MQLRDHAVLMAAYNRWMNRKLYDAARMLPAEAQHASRGAFFRSVFGTLNHICVADIIWLGRFARALPEMRALTPAAGLVPPTSLSQPLAEDLDRLWPRREWLDGIIETWVSELADGDLLRPVHYSNMRGEPGCKQLFLLMVHFFNHQTHHRGQATTLLSQAGLDVGVTDVLALVPEVE